MPQRYRIAGRPDEEKQKLSPTVPPSFPQDAGTGIIIPGADAEPEWRNGGPRSHDKPANPSFLLAALFCLTVLAFAHMYDAGRAVREGWGADFGYTYFFADLLRQDINIYRLDGQWVQMEQKRSYPADGIFAVYHPVVFRLAAPPQVPSIRST